MLRNWLTTINYEQLIKMQANQECGRISRKEIKGQYKSPMVASQKKKTIKIGKRR